MELPLVVNSFRKRNSLLSAELPLRLDTAPARLAALTMRSSAHTKKNRLLVR